MIHAIIVPADIKDAANAAAFQIGVDPEGLLTTLCVPLVPASDSDDAEPTHFACCGQISETALEWLEAIRNLSPVRCGGDGIMTEGFWCLITRLI